MKAKKWLAKPLALGLAIATAVTSMGVPGGLFTPQTAYAAEEDGSLVLYDHSQESRKCNDQSSRYPQKRHEKEVVCNIQ